MRRAGLINMGFSPVHKDPSFTQRMQAPDVCVKFAAIVTYIQLNILERILKQHEINQQIKINYF